LIAAMLAAWSTGTAHSAEPVKIRMSWVAPVTNWGSIVLEKKELAQHLGKSYTLEPMHFPGTPPMITALANNELEIATLAYSTLAIAVENAGMDDLRVIADEFRDGVEGYYSQEYMVLADMIPAVVPFAYDPELRKIARTLFVQRHAIGVTDMIVFTARKPFIDRNRAAMVDYFEDMLRITRWFIDPKNHTAVMEIAGRLTRQPPQRYDWLFTNRDAYHDPDLLPDLAALQKNVDMTRDLGFVRSSLDVGKHADLSMVEEAAKRLQ
jgi:ABC-type nitrate/sulfonate/bicarbonate transport system substrate-binding protein